MKTAAAGELSDGLLDVVAGGTYIDDFGVWIGSLFGE